jgi:hypothetical protein
MIRTLLAALVALAMLAGCSSRTMESKAHPDYDFSKLHKVAVLYPAINDPRAPEAQRLFDEAIEKVLRQKGYTVVPKQEADFYIVFHLGAKSGRQLSNDYRVIGIQPYYYGHGLHRPAVGSYYIVGPSNKSYEYGEGKIIVEAVDPHDDNLVFWQSKMTDKLRSFKTLEARKAYIDKVARKALASFPDRR